MTACAGRTATFAHGEVETIEISEQFRTVSDAYPGMSHQCNWCCACGSATSKLPTRQPGTRL